MAALTMDVHQKRMVEELAVDHQLMIEMVFLVAADRREVKLEATSADADNLVTNRTGWK